MAAPDRIDRVLMSAAVNPNIGSPPPRVHTERRVFRSPSAVMLVDPDGPMYALIVRSGATIGNDRRIRWIKDARHRTGHITGSTVR